MPTPLHQRNVQRCALAIHTACSFFGAEVQNVERQLPARPPQPQASDGFIPFLCEWCTGWSQSYTAKRRIWRRLDMRRVRLVCSIQDDLILETLYHFNGIYADASNSADVAPPKAVEHGVCALLCREQRYGSSKR